MIFQKESRPSRRLVVAVAAGLRVWARVALSALALLVVSIVASSCSYSPDVAEVNQTGAQTNTAQGAKAAPSVTVRTGTPAPGGPNLSTGATPDLTRLEPVPANVWETSIQSLDGKQFKLADYKGKIIVLDLWATWCGPCRDEIPHLIALSKEFAPKGVEVVGVTSEDPTRDLAKVQAFAKEFNISYKVGFAPQEIAIGLVRRGVIPQTFVITRDGHLLARFEGFHPTLTAPRLRQMVEHAVSRPSGT
ncbi:MAG TPA: TlpA disulfide reductase family protein [Pyrinomonadaceae bacterium]|jgi:thiol-disulfide isomerase/thioredoxin